VALELTLDERIARWLPPRGSEELRKVADICRSARDPAAYLRYALAHKGHPGTDAKATARVEQVVVQYLTTSPYTALSELVPALHLHFPAGLCEPRVRATIHLALELDVLGSSELVLVLQPLLASSTRFDAYVRGSVRGPLGARLRLAALCRGVASAARRVGGIASLLTEEHAEAFVQCVERLWHDRDPLVGVGAAWAAGTLLSTCSRLSGLVDAARSEAQNALLARRALVARTAAWIHGDLADDEHLDEIFRGSGRQDPNLRATVVSALRFGLRMSPDTVFDLVGSLVAKAPPEVLLGAARLVSLSDDPRAHALGDAVRARAIRFRSSHRELACLLWPEEPRATELMAGLREARQAALSHASAASSLCRGLLEVARESIDHLRNADRPAEQLGSAIDMLLLDSTLVRDAGVAGARARSEQAQVQRLWRQCATNLLQYRVAALPTSPRPGVALREAVRRLARAADAQSLGPLAERDADEGRDPRRDALGRILEICCTVNERVVDLALAAALDAITEPLLVRDELPALHLVALLVGVPSAGLLRHLAALLGASPPSRAVQRISELRVILDRRKSEAAPSSPGELARALGLLRDECSILRVDSALTRGIGGLHSAANATALEIPALVDAALGELAAAQREARSSAGHVFTEAPRQPDTLRAMRSLLGADGVGILPPGVRLYKPSRARREINSALPPALRGVCDALAADLERARRDSQAPAPTREPWVGRKLGDYVVIGVMGAGGMGYCLAVHRRLEKNQPGATRFVLKVPRQTDDLRPFREEAIALLSLAALNHPAIVRFLHFVDLPGKRPFIVMEYVEGETLEAHLRSAPLPLRTALSVAGWLADAIASSHDMGISHYDIKPANVILRPAGMPVLVDWGLAGTTEVFAGTIGYTAPERYALGGGAIPAWRSTAVASPADVFALGCLLAEMITGTSLFLPPILPDEDGAEEISPMGAAPSLAHAMAGRALVSVPRLHAGRVHRAVEAMPAGLFPLFSRMVAIDPPQRPRAREVAEELRRLVSCLPDTTPKKTG
jgi:hypothetical protein